GGRRRQPCRVLRGGLGPRLVRQAVMQPAERGDRVDLLRLEACRGGAVGQPPEEQGGGRALAAEEGPHVRLPLARLPAAVDMNEGVGEEIEEIPERQPAFSRRLPV